MFGQPLSAARQAEIVDLAHTWGAPWLLSVDSNVHKPADFEDAVHTIEDEELAGAFECRGL